MIDKTTPVNEETLLQRLQRLQTQIDKAKEFHSGEQLAQRIEGDLRRIMNSAYLNLTDAIHRNDEFTGKTEHICLLNRQFNSDKCFICGKDIEYPEGWKANDQ